MSATANLPTLEGASTASLNVGNGLSGFLNVLGSLSSGPSSPLAGVTSAMEGLETTLQIDVSGISERLPEALTTIRNALPADSLRYVEEIEQAYSELMRFLQDSDVVKQIQAGSSLEQTAMALVGDLLGLFQTRLGDLAANLIGAEELTRVREALQLIDDLRTNYAGNSAQLLPFLSRNLIGVAPDLLQGVTAHVSSALAVVAPLSDASLATAVNPARAAIAAAFQEVAQAIKDFDPANVALYGAVELKLQGLRTAFDSGFDTLEDFYAGLQTVVESHAWDTVFTTYRDLLDALPLDALPTVDDAVDQLAEVLNEFLARLTMVFSPEDLAARITRLSTSIQESFAQSPLGQARSILLGFIDRIRQAIEQVPTEQVQAAVEAMLVRVKQELDDLGITSIRTSIEEAFQDAQTFIDDKLDSGLLTQVEQGLADVLRQLEQIPFAEVGQELTTAIESAGSVIQELEDSLADGLEEIRSLLARLDELSFKPVADEVIEEIGTLKTKLQSIRPDALSDAEKLAIQAGLALLRAIDLEGMINTQLKNGFAELGNELKGLINQILAAWQDFRRRLGNFDPESVMGPLGSLLDQVTGAVQKLNGATLMAPLYELVESLKARLATLSPGSLLRVLREPYAQMMAVVERVNPDVWVAPLRTLYAEIDKLLGYVDIRPLLDTLEQKEKELFAQARQAIVDGLDSVNLPAPLDTFYATLKTITLALTDALFGDPEEGIRQVQVSVQNTLKLSTLFQPLDLVFDRLLQALDGVPRNDLVSVMEGLRTGLGMAMHAIDPRNVLRQLREGQGTLAELSPVRAAAGIPFLPGLRASLVARLELAPPGNQDAAASLLARFDLVVQPVRIDVESSRLRQLQVSHESLVNALRLKINSLEATGAEASYTRLDANLGRLLPAFLRQREPLTYEQLRAGLATLRPSEKARRLDATLDLFLARLKPMESAITPAINGFFTMIKDTALIIHPAMLKDAVSGVYDTVQAKFHVLDPDELAQSLRENIYEPLLDPLAALDPATLEAQLDGLYQGVLTSLTGKVKGFIDQVKVAVDQVLGQIRQTVAAVLGTLRAEIGAILKKLEDLLENLDTLVLDDLFGRLLRVIDNLETSFNEELDRVQHEFDAMLNAIPLGASGGSASVGL
jgi:molecular chaperone GrpE (heat shock protein)